MTDPQTPLPEDVPFGELPGDLMLGTEIPDDVSAAAGPQARKRTLPVFPFLTGQTCSDGSGYLETTEEGLSLLDLYAGMAMVGMLAGGCYEPALAWTYAQKLVEARPA